MRGYGTYKAVMNAVPLQPPQLAPGLPRGNNKGGIFDANWVPERVVNATHPTVRADSAHVAAVPQRIGARVDVPFDEMTPRPVAGFGSYVVGGQTQQPPIPIQAPTQPGAVESGIFGSYSAGPVSPLPIPSKVVEPHAYRSGILGGFGLNGPPPVAIPGYSMPGAENNGIFG